MQNHLIYSDNLTALRSLDAESVDLIYLDPPYNSKRDYNDTFGSVAQSKAFSDTWTFGDDDIRYLDELQNTAPHVRALLDGLSRVLSTKHGLYPYLVAMAVRLVELHRVLKPTGSIYLHIDPTASHYLKLVMDQIFGGANFRNEIIWRYRRWPAKTPNFQKMHDVILRYSKDESSDFAWNQLYEPLAASTVKTWGDSKQEAVIEGGRRARSSKTEAKSQGAPMSDVWDISIIAPCAKERTGYPTQKPLALLERIILASSNEGDVVLDPYMGSGTTIEAAAKHGRKWVGIDVTHHAVACTADRLRDLGLPLGKDQVIGIPADLAAARQLKADSPRQFDAWCVHQCDAKPCDHEDRIIGLRSFASIKDQNEHKRRALYLATAGDPPAMADVKNALALMKAKGCEVAFLYCFEMPEDPAVLKFINDLKPYKDDMRSIPQLSLITMREMLHGNSAGKLTSEWRARRIRDLNSQMGLDIEGDAA